MAAPGGPWGWLPIALNGVNMNRLLRVLACWIRRSRSSSPGALLSNPQIPPRAKWLLLSLLPATGRGLTPVQLQKVLFVFGQRAGAAVGADFYSFQPYHYGPFDAQIYSDAEFLAAHGLVTIEPTGGQSLRTYALTLTGRELTENLSASGNTKAVDFLARVVQWAQRLTFAQLVRSVYESFPAMRENSVFRDSSG